MKTAMQDMLEWIEQRFNNPQETEVFKKASELLEKEKDGIIDAVEFGLFNMHTTIDGKYYYDLKFNQNK